MVIAGFYLEDVMARSYKAPYATDNGPDRKRRKRKANKAVRAHKDKISDGKAYRKVSESWDICDFSFYDSSPKGRRK